MNARLPPRDDRVDVVRDIVRIAAPMAAIAFGIFSSRELLDEGASGPVIEHEP